MSQISNWKLFLLGLLKGDFNIFGEEYVIYLYYDFHLNYCGNVKCLKSCLFLIVCYVVVPYLSHEVKFLSHQITWQHRIFWNFFNLFFIFICLFSNFFCLLD